MPQPTYTEEGAAAEPNAVAAAQSTKINDGYINI